jgi:hypothetical protein
MTSTNTLSSQISRTIGKTAVNFGSPAVNIYLVWLVAYFTVTLLAFTSAIFIVYVYDATTWCVPDNTRYEELWEGEQARKDGLHLSDNPYYKQLPEGYLEGKTKRNFSTMNEALVADGAAWELGFSTIDTPRSRVLRPAHKLADGNNRRAQISIRRGFGK